MRYSFWNRVAAFEVDPGGESAQLLGEFTDLWAVQGGGEHERLQPLRAFAATGKQAMQLEGGNDWEKVKNGNILPSKNVFWGSNLANCR
jgi:hypothetical protein